MIRVALAQRRPECPLPEPRTLQRWFRAAGLGPAPPPIRPPRVGGRAGQPHLTWQIDAAELIPLRDRSLVSWLRIVDEATGAVLQTTVFPPRALDQVDPHATQQALRQAFTRWGRPERLRVDNGAPWGCAGTCPPTWSAGWRAWASP